MLRTILAAVDGSATSEDGLRAAIQFARDTGARLSILHVVDDAALHRSIAKNYAGAFVRGIISSLMDEGQRVLKAAKLAATRKRVKADIALAENTRKSVAETIVQQAGKVGADLIVIGTHGRRGLSRLVMGSDAEAVMRLSSVPVMLVPARKQKS